MKGVSNFSCLYLSLRAKNDIILRSYIGMFKCYLKNILNVYKADLYRLPE